jgi:hypothetical protein
MEVEAERPRRRLRGRDNGLRHHGIGWIDEKPNDARRGYELPEQFQPLRRYPQVQVGHAGDVAARPVQARHEAKLDRVAGRLEDDRNRCSCRLGGKHRRSRGRSNHRDPTLNDPARQEGAQGLPVGIREGLR